MTNNWLAFPNPISKHNATSRPAKYIAKEDINSEKLRLLGSRIIPFFLQLNTKLCLIDSCIWFAIRHQCANTAFSVLIHRQSGMHQEDSSSLILTSNTSDTVDVKQLNTLCTAVQDCCAKQRDPFPTAVTLADDSNNKVPCTNRVRSSLSLADNLTNKHVTTQRPFYNVHTHIYIYIYTHTRRDTRLSLKDLKAHTIQVLVWIITGRLCTVMYTYARRHAQDVHIHPFS